MKILGHACSRWSALAALALAVATLSGCARGGGGSAHNENDPNLVKLTSANFQEQVLASKKPVLVDFWAPWCGPCRTLGPTIAELAAEYKDRVTVGKVNVDDETKLSEQYKIEGIPAVFVFKDGKVVEQLIGLRPKADYQAVLNKLAGPAPAPTATAQ